MARRFAASPRSLKYYVAFLTLMCITAVVSFTINILHRKTDSMNAIDFPGKLSKDSVLLQKIQETAIKNIKKYPGKIPATGLLSKVRNSLNEDMKNRTNLESPMEKIKADQRDAEVEPHDIPLLNDNVHLFYYPWYGNPDTDGKYLHWNHRYLPHWRKEEAVKWPQGVHVPPDDIGSNFYPALGPYSSSDPVVVDKHMTQIQSSGAGVIVVSWYPPGQADENGQTWDQLIPLFLDSAHKHGIKVAIHIEPYKDRSGETLAHHVKYIIDSYGHHPGLYRREVGGKHLPVYYVYDSYQIASALWAQALKPDGRHTLRSTQYDGIFLGLYLGPEDEKKLLDAGFDGFYTYFAANGFTKGSTWKNWKNIAKFAATHSLLFVPSVGPGYVDTRVRPWNAASTRKRLKGQYFRQSFQTALDIKAEVISVTSFNEWHEGSQVEPAVPKAIKGFKYEDYSPGSPNFYLQLLKEYVDKFSQLWT